MSAAALFALEVENKVRQAESPTASERHVVIRQLDGQLGLRVQGHDRAECAGPGGQKGQELLRVELPQQPEGYHVSLTRAILMPLGICNSYTGHWPLGPTAAFKLYTVQLLSCAGLVQLENSVPNAIPAPPRTAVLVRVWPSRTCTSSYSGQRTMVRNRLRQTGLDESTCSYQVHTRCAYTVAPYELVQPYSCTYNV
eukprot:SAG25_NODE_2973_length_1287_cov_1.031145_1_plen_197_part_00